MGGVEIDYRKYNILLCDELLYLGRQKETSMEGWHTKLVVAAAGVGSTCVTNMILTDE